MRRNQYEKIQHEKEENTPKPPRVREERVPRPPRAKKARPPKPPKSPMSHNSSFGDFFRNRIVIGTICVVVSLLIAFVGFPVVQGYVSQRVPVVKVNTDLVAQGSLITADMLKISDVAAIDRPVNAAVSIEQTVGTYARYDLSPDDIITSNKLSLERPVSHPYLYDLPADKKAISVSVKGLAEGLSGKLKPGDVVSVYAAFNRGNAEENYAAAQPPELRYVRVLAVSNSLGYDIDVDSDDILSENKRDEREHLPATITLIVGDMQAASIAGIDHNATIHVALAARAEDTELCTQYLAEQEIFIAAVEAQALPYEESDADLGDTSAVQEESTQPPLAEIDQPAEIQSEPSGAATSSDEESEVGDIG